MKRTLVLFVAFALGLLFSVNALAQSASREDLAKKIEAKRRELADLEKQFLAPSAADREAFADFLSQPDTGLTRLLPREIYDSEVYKENKQTLTVRGGGAYYSFTRGTHEYSASTDIGLERGQLQTGFAGANYGMLTSLGDVPLENVSLETPAARILAAHNPATEEPQARIEQRKVSNDTSLEGTTYKNRLLVRLNSTYLVRAINYSASDCLVAFRVVRIDNDDSVIILWKLLEKYPTPYLARNN